MPQINLIAERRRSQARLTMAVRVVVTCSEILALGLVAVLVITTRQASQAQRQIEQAQGQIRNLQPRIDRLNLVESQVATMGPKLQLLTAAKESTLHWYLIFQEAGQGLPETSWLDNLTINHDDRTGDENVTLSGQSKSQYTVADTIVQMQNQPMFSEVDLRSVLQNAGDPSLPVHFEMTVQIKKKPDGKSA